MSSSSGPRAAAEGPATRRGLRSSDPGAPSPAAASGASKRKQGLPVKGPSKGDDPKSRPKVHAQRKFAQGQCGPSSASSSPVKVARAAAGGGRGSSSSSTASGPTANSLALRPKTGERPKTEDFLTFLCLRGTPLCPPELDFFNKASLENLPNESSEEEWSDQQAEGGGMAARKTVRRIEHKKESAVAHRRRQNGTGGAGRKLPASVQALKKKYTEQRLAKKVVSKTIPARRTRSQTEDSSPKRRGMSTRALSKKRSDGDGRAGASSPSRRLELVARKPSAAALVAKRKTRMATLTAASSRVSRMLTRLTPRGTSSAAFVKSTKSISLAGRSLRGRDISVSSEDEDSDEEDARKTKTPPKRRLKSRQSLKAAKKNDASESDADEESSSRDSSRKRTESRKLASHTSRVQKREARSASWDSSASKESGKSDSYSNRKARARDEDEVSVASSSDGRKGRRADASSSKESTPIRKIITPSIKRKEGRHSRDGNGNASEAERRRSKKEGEAKDKRKSKQSLKELQDMLLEEAKKNISVPGDADPSKREASEERITISQKTGYIQVKPRKSTDHVPTEEVTVIANPVVIGSNGRRMSKGCERTSTPPRKILPKPASESESTSSSSTARPVEQQRSHLPVGVIGAAAMSSSRVPIKVNGGTGQTVPLNQPLVINTGFPQQAPKAATVTSNPSNAPGSSGTSVVQQAQRVGGVQSVGSSHRSEKSDPTYQKRASQEKDRPSLPPSQSATKAQAKGSHNTKSNQQSGADKQMNSPGPPMLSPQAKDKGNPHQNVAESHHKHIPTGQSNQLPQQQPQQQLVHPQHAVQGVVQPQQMHHMNPQLQQQFMAQQTSQQHRPVLNVAPTAQQFVQGYPTAMPMQAFPAQHGAYGYANPQAGAVYQQQLQPVVGQMQQHQFTPMQGFYPNQQPQQQILPQQQHQQPTKVLNPMQSSRPLNTMEGTKTQAKAEGNKHKTIYSKGLTPQAAKSQPSSFRVENETSPYAFEEAEQPNVPYRKSTTPKAGPSKEHSKKQRDASANKSSSAKKPSPNVSGSSVQCNLEDAKEMGSSIPIPKELANQLAAQAKKERSSGNAEMTYFIPLQSSSGQSFGVAVKLATEGPDGPDQKVIMKAKLVTQPSGKPAGARIIGARETKETVTSPTTSAQSGPAKVSPKSPKASTSERKFARMPMASPVSPAHSSDSEDSSRPSTSTGRMGSPDSFKGAKQKPKMDLKDDAECCLGMVETLDRFPKLGQHAHLVEAPVYTPTEKEFKDPMKFIECIRKDAEQFGVCRIIPPSSFKPECNVDDDMRFTAYNQMVHKMMSRWGPNAKEMAAIKKYLETQNVVIKVHPVVGGVEIDLPALFHAVQSFGGLTEVIQRKRWGKIADYLRIPKGTQDRGNKLDDIYCKYLLPYDTLSSVERDELLRLVEEEFEEGYKHKLERSRNDDDEEEEEEESEEDEDMDCVIKGKSTSLSQFFRVARNMMTMIFRQAEPDPREVEEEYWRIVSEKDCHVQVQQGSIDTGDEGFGFPTTRGSSCGRHAWNLKILSNNPRSLLRCMGPVMGVTVPTLNVGMVFTGGCWYRDPHGLPWVDYHHTGSPKIWYSVPDSHSIAFYTAMKQLVPTFCRKKKIWLPADTAMVPPNLLVKYGVPVCRTVQQPGEFLVVFPKTFTSYVCSGYSVSESVYFAPRDYLSLAEDEFRSIRESGEPMMFPLPRLLIAIAQDDVTSRATLRVVRPFLERMRDNEYVKRTMLSDLGVKTSERIVLKTKKQDQEDEYECEICSENLYVSYMCDVKEDTYYCMQHAIEYLQEKKITQRKHCKLLYTHSKEEISAIIKAVNRRLNASDESSSSSDEDDLSHVKRSYVKRPPPPMHNVSTESILAASTSQPGSVKGKGPGKRKYSSTSSTTRGEGGGSDDDEITFNVGKSAKIRRKEQEEKFMKKVSKPIARKDEKEETPTPPPSTSSSTPKGKPGKKSPDSAPASKRKSTAASGKEESSKKKPKEKKAPKEVPQKEASKPRRKTKARKAAQDGKHGNLTTEILDMLLSASEDESDESGSDDDGSDESWK